MRVSFPALDSTTTPNRRVLRLRGEPSLAERIRVAGPGRGSVRVPTRERVEPGQPIRLEIGFGALHDEIVMDATVREVRSGEGDEPPLVVCLVENKHAARLAYVYDVLTNRRDPVSRRYRRVQVRLRVRWIWRGRTYGAFTGDISCGGAFLISPVCPPVETEIDLGLWLDPETEPIELAGIVIWSGTARREQGFGIRFRHIERETFARLQELVRLAEND